jgi:prophage tail gpP-like protein
MSDNLPPLPSHPEHAWLWTEAEKMMIRAYAAQAVAERDAEIGRLKAALEKIADLEIEALRAQLKADRDYRGQCQAQAAAVREIERLREHAVVLAATVEEVEREACADICDQHASAEGIAQRCAAAIRARSKE